MLAGLGLTLGLAYLVETLEWLEAAVSTEPVSLPVELPVDAPPLAPTLPPPPTPPPSTPSPTPPIPTPTSTPARQKHIALGLADYIFNFWYDLNVALNPLGIDVYQFNEWFEAGLTDIPYPYLHLFNVAFIEATERAAHIHFNLQGIPEPNHYAEEYGGSGVWGAQVYLTAWELWTIKHNPSLCGKTTFYENGITPSPSAKASICGP